MKNSSLTSKLWMLAITLLVLTYFGVQIFRYVNDPLVTTPAYAYEVEDTVELSGCVVRQEQVLEGGSDGLVRLRRSEGERVSTGGAVATVYADQASLDRQNEIDALNDRIEQLEYAQTSMLDAEAALKLDSQISLSLLDYRAAIAAGRLDTAETQGRELRSLVLKRDYTYSDAEDLSGQLSELKTQLSALRSQSANSVKTLRSPRSGLFSAVVDGYETVLTPDALSTLTPAALSALTPTEVTEGSGKLILGDSWYYAGTVSASEAERLRDRVSHMSGSDSLYLRFARGVDRELQVTLESVSAEENGQCVVVLKGSTYLQELTLLRRQSAEIVLDSTGGIRVPRAALRVDVQTVTETDEAAGTETEKEVNVTGVYCIIGAKAQFKPVEVLFTGDEYAVVRPTGQVEKRKLRSGDTVIVTARDLYDGKVIS